MESDQWREFLTGQMAEEEAEALLSHTAADLHAFLEAQPSALSGVLGILDKRLKPPLQADTWEVLDGSLANYMGRDLAYLFGWVVRSGQADRLEQIEDYASAQVQAFFRTVLGLYGAELGEAFAAWNEIPDDWRTLFREVYFDQLAQRHHIKLRVLKYSGDSATVEGPADSILGLTSGLILTLRLVGIPEAFSAEKVDQFMDELNQFLALLFPEENPLDDFMSNLDNGAV